MFHFSIFFSPEFDCIWTSFSPGCLLSMKLFQIFTSEFAWSAQCCSHWLRSSLTSFFSSSSLKSSSTLSRRSLKTSSEISSAHHFHLLKSKEALFLRRWMALPFFLSVLKFAYLTRMQFLRVDLAYHLVFWSFHQLDFLHLWLFAPKPFWSFS